jgi:hypothetical protein
MGGIGDHLRGEMRIAYSPSLAARGKTRAALRAGLFRQIGVGKSRKIADIPAIFRLDLTENSSLSQAGDFHHGL